MGQDGAVAHVEVACLEGAFLNLRLAAVDGVEVVGAGEKFTTNELDMKLAYFGQGVVINTCQSITLTSVWIHQPAQGIAVFLPALPCVHSGVEAVIFCARLAGDGFGVGVFRSRHLDYRQCHLVLHHEAELEAVGAVGAVGHRAARHHQVVGGVGGVGALVVVGHPAADKGGEKLLGGPGCSGRVFNSHSGWGDGLYVHILVLLPGIIGVVVRPAAVRLAFGGELRARGQRPRRAVVGEAEVVVFVGDLVLGRTTDHFLLYHLVEPYLVSDGEFGAVA
ncbi:hypothetical protein ABHZ39_17630, partial [Bacteroides uniformis]